MEEQTGRVEPWKSGREGKGKDGWLVSWNAGNRRRTRRGRGEDKGELAAIGAEAGRTLVVKETEKKSGKIWVRLDSEEQVQVQNQVGMVWLGRTWGHTAKHPNISLPGFSFLLTLHTSM